MVFNPNGICKEHKAQIKNVLGISTNIETPIKANGITTSLTKEIIYTLTFEKAFFKENDDTTTPVKIIAIGDIQSPETSIIDIIHLGIGMPHKPIVIPITIETNIGLTKDFKLSLIVGFLSQFAISNLGTPQS